MADSPFTKFHPAHFMLIGAIALLFASTQALLGPSQTAPPGEEDGGIVTPTGDVKPEEATPGGDDPPDSTTWTRDAIEAPGEPTTASSPPASPASPALQEPREQVLVVLLSRPTGATVSRDKVVLGRTPLTLALDRENTPVDLVLTRRGYEPKVISVTPALDQELRATLRPSRASQRPR